MTKKVVNVEQKAVSFYFDNGTVLECPLSSLTDEIVLQLALHGLSQKIGDSYAGAKSATADGHMTPAEWSEQTAAAVWGDLKAGDWTTRTAGGPKASILAEAIANLTKKPIEEIILKLEELSKEAKKAIGSDPEVAAEVAQIKAERARIAAEKKLVAAMTDTNEEGTAIDLGNLF